jgi:hypothetical protein
MKATNETEKEMKDDDTRETILRWISTGVSVTPNIV